MNDRQNSNNESLISKELFQRVSDPVRRIIERAIAENAVDKYAKYDKYDKHDYYVDQPSYEHYRDSGSDPKKN
jgi:TRAP-type mannitol/chloroaromatic compound transport system substrate-binding protein